MDSYVFQGRGKNLKQLPQTFIEVFSVDDVILISQLMTSHRKIDIAIKNYIVTSPSNYCCQISIIVGERPGISVTIHCILSLRQERVNVNIFWKFVYKDITIRHLNRCIVTHVCWHHYCANLAKANEALLKVRIITMR